MSNINLRMARKAANFTQEQLAKALGVNRATVSKYETGEISPSVDQLIKICNILDVSFEELIGEDPGAKPSEIRQSMKLDFFIRELGYEFYDSYPDVGSETWLCVDNNKKKLYLLRPEDISMTENSIHDYTKFQIAELLKKGKEIPDTGGWFKGKKKSPQE